MVRMVLKIDGMACSMCEAHVNDAIRRAFPVKKVVSSHGKGQTEIFAEAEIPQDRLAAVLQDTGYRLLSMATEPHEKKKFSLFGK